MGYFVIPTPSLIQSADQPGVAVTWQPPTVAAILVVDRQGRLLLERRRVDHPVAPVWSLPEVHLRISDEVADSVFRGFGEAMGICLGPLTRIWDGSGRSDHSGVPSKYVVFAAGVEGSSAIAGGAEQMQWVTPDDARMLEIGDIYNVIVPMFLDSIQYRHLVGSQFASPVDVLLIYTRDEEVLLSLRMNTGYADGQWSLPSGRLELGEALHCAMVREAQEELGITLQFEHLKFASVVHWGTPEGLARVGVFFHVEADAQQHGEPYNAEPRKCGGLRWYRRDALPENTLSYGRYGIDLLRKGNFYSAAGWLSSNAAMGTVGCSDDERVSTERQWSASIECQSDR